MTKRPFQFYKKVVIYEVVRNHRRQAIVHSVNIDEHFNRQKKWLYIRGTLITGTDSTSCTTGRTPGRGVPLSYFWIIYTYDGTNFSETDILEGAVDDQEVWCGRTSCIIKKRVGVGYFKGPRGSGVRSSRKKMSYSRLRQRIYQRK